MKTCCQTQISLNITHHLMKNANKHLLSDVGCAAHTLKSAFMSAKLNVEVNLMYLTDESFVAEVKDELETIELEINGLTELIVKSL